MDKILQRILTHTLGWIVLISVPYLTTYQVLKASLPIVNFTTYTPIFIVTAINIAVFYSCYLWLVPKFLFKKNFLGFFIRLVMVLALIFTGAALVFIFMGMNPESFEAHNPSLRILRPIANANALLLLTISFITSITLAYSNRIKQAESERHNAQIASLISQMNPHFLFNTLNNIYASAIDTSPKAASMIDRLSEMMRYSMSETFKESVDISSEMKYIKNYIELQKMRLHSLVDLRVRIEDNFGPKQIAPMMLIPFIENAFKYGVNPERKSMIKIEITNYQNSLVMFVSNTIVANASTLPEPSGIGVNNTKNRLELIYPQNHLLDIKHSSHEYNVSLIINLK